MKKHQDATARKSGKRAGAKIKKGVPPIIRKDILKLYTEPHSCGAHTIQAKTAAKLTGTDNNGIWRNGVAQYKPAMLYRYQLTPSVPKYGNRYTLLSGCDMPNVVADMTAHQPCVVERVDFAFDNYTHDYNELFRLNNAVLTLFAIKYNLDNNGMTLQMSADADYQRKNVFVKSQRESITGKRARPFEVECYAKNRQYPNCGIKSRLELRCLIAGGTVAEAGKLTLAALDGLLTPDTWAEMVRRNTAILRTKWSECSKHTHVYTWLCENRQYIVSVEQARAILAEITGRDGAAKLDYYNDIHKDMP